MIIHTRSIAQIHLGKCFVSLLFPAFLLGLSFIISYASGISQAESHARLINSPPLMTKAVMNGTLGIIGLALWGFFMLSPALIALHHRRQFLIERNGNLIFLGKVICRSKDIQDCFVKESGMKKVLFVVLDGKQIIEVGDIAMCKNVKNSINAVRNIGLR